MNAWDVSFFECFYYLCAVYSIRQKLTRCRCSRSRAMNSSALRSTPSVRFRFLSSLSGTFRTHSLRSCRQYLRSRRFVSVLLLCRGNRRRWRLLQWRWRHTPGDFGLYLGDVLAQLLHSHLGLFRSNGRRRGRYIVRVVHFPLNLFGNLVDRLRLLFNFWRSRDRPL